MSEIIEKLKEKYGYENIYIIRSGIFFIAIDIDAYILGYILGLKKTKFSNSVLKVGFPATSLKKYIEILKKEDIPFYVLDYVEEENILSEYVCLEGKKFEIKMVYKSR